MTKPVNILNKYELKSIATSENVDYNNFYKYELIKMIEILKEENKQLNEYCCKRNECSGRLKENHKLTGYEIIYELEKWLEEEKQISGDVTMKISEISIAILKKLKELKGE